MVRNNPTGCGNNLPILLIVRNLCQAPGSMAVHAHADCSRTRLFLLLPVEGTQTTSCNFDNLESHTWDITHSVTTATEASNQHFIVLIYEVQAAIFGDKACDLLAILDELHTA